MGFNWGNGASGAASGAIAGSSFGPWGTAIGGGLGGLAGLFGSDNDPSKEAGKYLDQIPPELRKYLEPYFNAGTGALGNLEGQYGQLTNDPNSIIARLGAGYTKSPGYDWRLKQGEEGINNAAAAGGTAGTPMHQQLAGQLSQNMAGQDYQNYLNSAIGLYGTGLQGQQNLANMGQSAGNELATGMGNLGLTRAGLGYAGQAGQNQQTSDLLSSLLAYLSKR